METHEIILEANYYVKLYFGHYIMTDLQTYPAERGQQVPPCRGGGISHRPGALNCEPASARFSGGSKKKG
jgi:hypothetical protein